MQIAAGLGLVLAGIALAAFGAVRLREPRRAADVEWERRHTTLAKLLAGPSFSAEKPATVERTGAAGCVLGGVMLVVTGAAFVFG